MLALSCLGPYFVTVLLMYRCTQSFEIPSLITGSQRYTQTACWDCLAPTGALLAKSNENPLPDLSPVRSMQFHRKYSARSLSFEVPMVHKGNTQPSFSHFLSLLTTSQQQNSLNSVTKASLCALVSYYHRICDFTVLEVRCPKSVSQG